MAEHCVKIHLKLTHEHGSEEEIEQIRALEETLEDEIEKHGVGEFDGDEFGGGECVLYIYGPDADRLFDAIKAPLQSSPFRRGGYVVKRYGPPEDGIKEETIRLSSLKRKRCG